MSKTLNVLLAGFGGQGILFAGKQLAEVKKDFCFFLQKPVGACGCAEGYLVGQYKYFLFLFFSLPFFLSLLYIFTVYIM